MARTILREVFYVQLSDAEGNPYFVDASASLGKKPEFKKPLATVALRSTPDATVLFVNKLNDRARKDLLAAPLPFPVGPVSKTEKLTQRAEGLSSDKVVVHYEDTVEVFTVQRDANGVTMIEPEGDEKIFELPRKPVRLTILTRSMHKDRPLGISWTGFLNKPGTPETLTRAVAYALNHLTGLDVFRRLSGIVTVKVPAPPGRYTVARVNLRPGQGVKFVVPLVLWTAAPSEHVAAGTVDVEVDLDSANASTGLLLFKHTPSANLSEFYPTYEHVLDKALNDFFLSKLGPDEMSDVVCDIALGEVDDKLIERLTMTAQEVMSPIAAIDVNPTTYAPPRLHG